ncbi:hypothetical protein QBC40DRAFT_282873 [Triangularia verruculosa]|uniref:DUF427 domain-containing protein n=1 Tax=Triangularia verruculosa TaxID=2587418 RepID=A0AAN6XGL0_9PEZI|nr:hypothetical protein QBC40DRAFT_282873 [Triangularia verruculosa]
MSNYNMSAMRKHNVTTFPRPPVVDRVQRHIQIKWHGQLIADCPPGEAYWCLETHHAPTYFIPPSRVRLPLSTTPRTSFDEFRGPVTYYAMMSPINAADTVSNRIWSFNEPPKDFEAIKGYLAFFAGPWECYVDGERAQPPPQDFYGGWVTNDIEGINKAPHAPWGVQAWGHDQF